MIITPVHKVLDVFKEVVYIDTNCIITKTVLKQKVSDYLSDRLLISFGKELNKFVLVFDSAFRSNLLHFGNELFSRRIKDKLLQLEFFWGQAIINRLVPGDV